ncbi:MAG TPA: zinc ribbon domain-containing protein [Prosthecobacter sp.]|nr:zinc ribbon domain-containing protein [Prosthecobacter sp.]
MAQRCDFCGSSALIDVDDIQAPIRPGSLMPFEVAEGKVREEIRRWYGSHFWAPNKLGGTAMTDTLHGLYVPYWTFDAHAECPWEAEAGHYYYTRDSQGRSQRHTRWEHASGHVSMDFDDVLVPASKGVHPRLLDGLEPYPTTTALKPYDPGYLAGWVVEQYQIDLVQGAQDSRSRMEDQLRAECARQIPGDTHRNLRTDPQFSAQTFKHILLPMWLLTYTYGSKNYQVAVNGATGKITGEYPLSWVKITIAIVLALIVICIFVLYSD